MNFIRRSAFSRTIGPITVVGLLLVWTVLHAQAPAAGRSFTIDQILSAPFASELTASTRGGTLAFAMFERGRRNVYLAEAPAYQPRRLTDYGTDDGQELTGLVFSGDGRHVVYVRGGDHGSNWPAEGDLMPNPTSSPVQPKMQVWAVPLAGGAPTLIGEGDDPAPAAGAAKVAFVRQGKIWLGDTTGTPATLMFFARGRSASPAWAPDGRTLAFVSERGDHSFIALFTGPDQPLRYLAPSTARDSGPVWSPDGRRLAFVRQPGRGAPRASGLQQPVQPWALWVADVSTGEAREVWHSDATPAGSVPRTAGGVNLHWADGDRLVFLSYQDGWPHLYSVPAAGGTKATLLTPGAFMVEHVSMTPDRRWMVYNANTGSDPNDIDRRHLWRVPVDRAAPEPLTNGLGNEWSPIVTGDGATLAYFAGGVQTPGLPTVVPFGGGSARPVMADALPLEYPAGLLVTPQPVVVNAPDGTAVHCQLFKTASGDTRRPAVIFVHGGPPRQMLLGWHYGFYYANTYALNQYLASRGFVVLSVNYRLGIGYGHAFQYPSTGGARGAAEYQDVLAAGRYLQARPDVDRARIGIYGGSYGGYLTALALGRNSDVFATGVDLHGVHDWAHRVASASSNPELAVSALVGDGVSEDELRKAATVAWESSPVSAISTWKSPVLLIHGDDDRNVQFQQTVDLVQRLKAKGVPFEEMIIPDDIHDFLLHRNWVAASRATAAWMERMLGRTTGR
ncbi:MAG TPA: prolyl oligopeptidase family serine peptidase [Vicinamibacterales bacterium]|jgi:acetyl esterase/lipase